MTRRLSYITLALVLITPVFAFAQGFSRDGIMGCNASQYGGSPGTTAATQGVFVPVFDAAVALNTGVLVYKECVLKGVANRLRENATASIGASATKAFLTGRKSVDANGNAVEAPLFSQDFDSESLAERDRATVQALQNLDTLNPALRDSTKRAIARGYYNSTRNRASALACPYDDVTNALEGNPASVDDALAAFQIPACSPLGAYITGESYVDFAGNNSVNNLARQLDWGRGVYDVSTIDANGRRITTTPASFVASSQEQILQSGYRQAESADDIDEMVSALFSGLSTQILRSSQGLAGLAQPIGNQPSYLDQMTTASAQGLRDAVNNAAIAVLRDAQLVEKAYGDIMRAILAQLQSSQNSFRAAESLCWSSIIQKACAGGTLKFSGGTATCTSAKEACTTDASGTRVCSLNNQLQISTSTIYSRNAILNGGGAETFNLAGTVEKNIQTSDNALKLFANLIQSVSGSASQSVQLQAQLQLDQLIAQGLIHKQSGPPGSNSLDEAVASKNAIDATIAGGSTLASNIKKLWNGDANDGTEGVVPWNGTYPPDSKNGNLDIAGWCNVGETTAGTQTIDRWIAKWKK